MFTDDPISLRFAADDLRTGAHAERITGADPTSNDRRDRREQVARSIQVDSISTFEQLDSRIGTNSVK